MDGIVPLLKPPGMTSSNAVYDVRRIFSAPKAGHLGTLDPGAAGVLPICLGRATRLFDFLVEKEKRYVCEIAFGVSTDTQDVFGSTLTTGRRDVSRAELAGVLPDFCGTQPQTAPLYSALKVGGKKMYDLARAGVAVEPKTREITVSSLELLEETGEGRFLLALTCSRGTYVRTLCADIGERLGTAAHMSLLIRTAAGPFTLAHSVTVPELQERKTAGTLTDALVSCEEALSMLPAVELPADRRTPTVNGLDTFLQDAADGNVRVYCGGFLGVGTVKAHRLKLAVHLY